MDFNTGLVGVRRRVSYQQFRELLEEPQYRGSTVEAFKPTTDQIRHLIDELIRVGLLERQPKRRKTDPLVFFLPLASSDSVRLREDPQMNPKGGTPKVTPIRSVTYPELTPKGTPKEEPHTSESPNKDKVFTNVNTVEKNKNSSGDDPSDSSIPSCPHSDLLALWDEIMPPHVRRPRASMWTRGRAGHRNLVARWKWGFATRKTSGEKIYEDLESGLAWWRKLFSRAAESGFLTEGRFFDLDWLLKADNFRKVIEGNYSS